MENNRTYAFWIATTIAILMPAWSASGQEQPSTGITLDRALELARENNPTIEAARQRIDEAQGDLIGASMLLVNNPRVAAAAGQRRSSAAGAKSSADFEVGLRQRLEIAGQRGHRVDSATAQKRVAEASAEEVTRVVELAVTLRFYDAIVAGRRVQIREEGRQLSERLFQVATRRLERGAGTHLELNTARIRQAEAQRRLGAARASRRVALLHLRQLLALPADQPLAVQGTLPDTRLNQAEDGLVVRALEVRPDLRTAASRVETAQAAAELASAEAWPDVWLGVSYSVEEGDNIILGGLQLSIPIFNRNQGPRHRARAAVLRTRAEHDSRQLAVEAEVRRAYTEYTQALDALSLYDADVLRAHEESLALLQRAFEAGEVGYADVIVVQREVLEGREGLLDVRLDLSRAHATLLASASISQTTKSKGDIQ